MRARYFLYIAIIAISLFFLVRPAHAFVYGSNGCDQTTAYMGGNMNVSTNCQSYSSAQAVCVASQGTGALISAPGINPMECRYSAAYPPNFYHYEATATPNCVSPQYLDTASNTCVSRVYGSNGCDQTTAYMGSNPSSSPVTAYCSSYAAARAVCVGSEGGQALITNNGINPMECRYSGAYPADIYYYEVPPPPTCTAPQYLDTATNTCTSPPTCTAPQVLDNVTHTCVAPSGCPAAGTLHSKGFFNVGTVPTGKLLNTACVNGCKIDLKNGYVPAAKSLIDGVYHYFGNADYYHAGTTCTPDTPNFLSDFVGSLPGQTCAAGQQMISMNGVTKCFDSTGAQVVPDSAAAVAAAKAAADTQMAKAVADARAAVAAAGGMASDVQAAQNVATGVVAAGGAGSTQTAADSVMAQYCKDNPTASICVSNDFGTVEDATLTDKPISVAITPVSVGTAGSCPSPIAMTIHGQQYWFTWTTYCNFATGIKPILLAFAWLSAAGILIGGFRN